MSGNDTVIILLSFDYALQIKFGNLKSNPITITISLVYLVTWHIPYRLMEILDKMHFKFFQLRLRMVSVTQSHLCTNRTQIY
jgi:hypothetical protein